MSRLPKPSGLPKPNFGLSSATSLSHLNKIEGNTKSKDNGTIPKAANGKGISTLRAPISRRSRTCTDFKRQPLRPANQITSAEPLRQPLKRTCPTISEVKPKISRPNPVKTTAAPKAITVLSQKNIRRSIKPSPVKRPAKPAAYDYKARFGLLQDKHTKTVNILQDTKEKLRLTEERNNGLDEKIAKTKTELQEYKEKCGVQDTQLKKIRTGYEVLEKENGKLIIENEKLDIEVKKQEGLIFDQNKRIQDYEIEIKNLNNAIENLENLNNKFVLQNDNLTKCLKREENLVVEYRERLQSFDLERRKLHNDIQDLKGNIRVFCRIRPPLKSESHRYLYSINYLDESSIEIRNGKESIEPTGRPRTSNHQFSFDKIFSPESTQKDIFLELSQLVQSVLDGYNVCVFAYGQTGSGKTYTMEGGNNVQSSGMIPRACELIFETLEAAKKIGWIYTIEASFLEIYNEKINDLLDKNKQELEIKMVDQKGDVYVTNLTTKRINSADELVKYMIIAQRNRAVASTEYNERSSRSHSVAKIGIQGVNAIRNESLKSCLNLVDLAGSEKVQTVGTSRLEETKNINKSLATLAHVILSLKEKNEHIPYRNCKLTYLLMPSLGGNSKTLMLVNIAPFEECFGESVNSLRFATNVNQCKTGAIKKNKSRNLDVMKTPQQPNK